MVAGHPVTPSDQVDQAWHLHLTYTRSYWEDFCGKILPRPLHHEPTKGGSTEGRKFDDWYGKTLESYRRLFGEEPPADIWPDASVRFGDDVHFVRVNERRHWIIAKPRRALAALKLVPVAGIALALVGCTSAAALASFPFDLHGPEFLIFFCLFSAAVLLVALNIRRRICQPHQLPIGYDFDKVSPWSTALLTGGMPRAITALLALLNRYHSISVDELRGVLTAGPKPPPSIDPLTMSLWNRFPDTGTWRIKSAEKAAEELLAPLEAKLAEERLLLPPELQTKATWLPLLVCSLIPLVGGIKVLVGLSRDKPVGFLVLGILLGVGISLGLFTRKARRSGAGDQVVSILKRRHADLESPTPKFQQAHSEVGFALPMAVALFGSGALANAGLGSLENLRRGTEFSGATIGGSGGCGGSGCGGGGDSGCGGGGCGGGGCGGCGGGD